MALQATFSAMQVESWLKRAARSRPEHNAVGTLTYERLHARALDFAGELRADGARIHGIAVPPGEEFVIALHGCLLAGVVAVPIDPQESDERCHDLMVSARDELVRVAADLVAAPESVQRHSLAAPAVVVHTSGTSGTPKPVVLTFGNWLWSALGSATALGHPAAERWLGAMPLTHVGGLSILIRSVIAATTVVLHERFETERVLAALRDPDGPTLVSLVPTTLARLLDAGLERPPALRHALLGGAPIPSALLGRARAAGVPVTPTYGLTEACSQVCTDGVPLFCTDVAIAPDGEVLVGGPTVSPSASDPGDGLLHSGDLGLFGDDRRLRITGRRADTIITGGENVAPAEVEAVLEAHPDVLEAAVVGVADEQWGEALRALVRVRGGSAAPTEDELGEHCAAALARFKLPKSYIFIDAPLPRTRSGKLLRRRIETG